MMKGTLTTSVRGFFFLHCRKLTDDTLAETIDPTDSPHG
jgi:hypothetical protein